MQTISFSQNVNLLHVRDVQMRPHVTMMTDLLWTMGHVSMLMKDTIVMENVSTILMVMGCVMEMRCLVVLTHLIQDLTHGLQRMMEAVLSVDVLSLLHVTTIQMRIT